MIKAPDPRRLRSVATILGLVTASLGCLCAGALRAVAQEGLPRLLFAVAGFAGYLYFFAHALRAIGLPRVIIEWSPDPERLPDSPAQSGPYEQSPLAHREAPGSRHRHAA